MVINKQYKIKTSITLWIILILITCSCAKRQYFTPADPHWKDADSKPVTDPGQRDPELLRDYVERSVFNQLEEDLDLTNHYRKLTGSKRQAVNINSFDETPNSSWFTNRQGLFELTPEAITQGVENNSGPETNGPWTLFRPKVQGITPGFWIKDANGEMYIIKFDPKGFSELSTGSDALVSRFFYAVGYNVPHESVVFWREEIINIKDGLQFTDTFGTKRAFTLKDLSELLARVEKLPDGRYRSLASHLLPNVRGPFSFKGKNRNDANDWCRHEDRRELRALKVFCSFVNHWDIKDQNTMDTWVPSSDESLGYLKHHLMDFGSSMGSAGHGPANIRMGYANNVDWQEVYVSFLTLGLKKWQWEDALPFEHNSIGYFESEIFHPNKWDPGYPIPSFEKMTNRDAYWAAKIVMSFRDQHLNALIKSAQYTNPEAREYILQTLKTRRDKIGRYWFDKVNPLDKFDFTHTENGYLIQFTDLATLYALEDQANTIYQFRIKHNGNDITSWTNINEKQILLDQNIIKQIASVYKNHEPNDPANHTYEISIRTSRNGNNWSKDVLLYLWYHPDTSLFQLVGLEHRD